MEVGVIGVWLIGAGPETSQVGEASGSIMAVVPGRSFAGKESNFSMNVTWYESKTWPDILSHNWYALEWGEYLMSVHGVERQ